MKPVHLLGLSAYYHDSAACLVRDGEIVAAAQEERFTRKKGDSNFPAEAAAFCLKQAGIRAQDLDAVAFYDKPLLKFERILETYMGIAPAGLRQYLLAGPLWIKEKLFMERAVTSGWTREPRHHHVRSGQSGSVTPHRTPCCRR